MNEHDSTELAFKNGYKKAVSEILEEIEKHRDNIHGVVLLLPEELAELKKKYTKGE